MFSKAIFLDVLAVYVFCLYISNRRQPGQIQTRKMHSNKMDLFLDALTGLALIVPLVYIFTPWLDFADYRLSVWFSLVGVLFFVLALGLLGKAYSKNGFIAAVGMKIRYCQLPVGQGIHRNICRPIYAGYWLWSIAQPLLLHNWIAGFVMLMTFMPIYWVQVSRKEQIVFGQFREGHQEYR